MDKYKQFKKDIQKLKRSKSSKPFISSIKKNGRQVQSGETLSD